MSNPKATYARLFLLRWLAPALLALVALGACGGELAVTPSECDSLRGTSCTGSKGCSLVETSAKVEVCGPACPHQNTCLDGRKPLLGTHYRQPDESEDYIFRADVCICVP